MQQVLEYKDIIGNKVVDIATKEATRQRLELEEETNIVERLFKITAVTNQQI